MSPTPFIALTNKKWFDFLAELSPERRVDEVNFWSPSTQKPIKKLRPGEPVFFRLKSPDDSIAGYGFFAHFTVLELAEAWNTFGPKNGTPDLPSFLSLIGSHTLANPHDPSLPRMKRGCTILRDAVFWPRERWIPWREEQGWARGIQRCRTEHDPARATRLIGEIQLDSLREPEDFLERFELIDADERAIVLARTRPRAGQGSFRARLLDAYGRRCAITGEKTEPVLQAAHVQPYLGPRSNHLQNGLVLTQEFHTLFDQGYVTITPDYRVRVSRALHERWSNGKRFYGYDSQPLRCLPDSETDRPSPQALEWHGQRVFQG